MAEGKSQQWFAIKAEDVWKTLLEINKNFIESGTKMKALKGRYHLKKKHFSFAANASVGAVNASGEVGAGLALGKEFYGKAQVSGSASATAFQSRIKAGLNWDKFGINVKGGAKLATASADGVVGVGKMKFVDYDGNKYIAKGAGGMLSAQASLVEAEASGGFTIFGVKIGASLAFQAGGVGGTVGGFVNTEGISGSLGALFGLGVNLKVSVNWSGFLKWRKERKRKKALNEKQHAEMTDRLDKEEAAKQGTGIVPPAVPVPAAP